MVAEHLGAHGSTKTSRAVPSALGDREGGAAPRRRGVRPSRRRGVGVGPLDAASWAENGCCDVPPGGLFGLQQVGVHQRLELEPEQVDQAGDGEHSSTGITRKLAKKCQRHTARNHPPEPGREPARGVVRRAGRGSSGSVGGRASSWVMGLLDEPGSPSWGPGRTERADAPGAVRGASLQPGGGWDSSDGEEGRWPASDRRCRPRCGPAWSLPAAGPGRCPAPASTVPSRRGGGASARCA